MRPVYGSQTLKMTTFQLPKAAGSSQAAVQASVLPQVCWSSKVRKRPKSFRSRTLQCSQLSVLWLRLAYAAGGPPDECLWAFGRAGKGLWRLVVVGGVN